MAKVTDKIWLEIQTLYETGEGVRSLSKTFKVPSSTIQSRAKNNGWQLGKIAQAVNAKVAAVKDLVISSAQIAQNVAQRQLSIIDEIVAKRSDLHIESLEAQQEALTIMRKAANAADRFIDKHSDGTYIKSNTDKGITYGLTSEVIPHMAALVDSTNKIINGDKAAVTINNVNAQHNNVVIPDDPIEAARVYDDFIRGDK